MNNSLHYRNMLSADVFHNQQFGKNSFRNTIKVSVWIQIWPQTVFKGYQQMTLIMGESFQDYS